METPRGFRIIPEYLSPAAQAALVETLRGIVAQAPFFRPVMPGNGRPFSVEMTNAGPLGWVSDRAGYRYQPMHPVTGEAWPAIPDSILDAWGDLTGYPSPPECCLINLYRGEKAKMGLHRDADEEDFDAPVLSFSLGDTATFRLGGATRRGPTKAVTLHSGTALILGGDSRMAYHGISKVMPGTSRLLTGGGRLNLTLRRVTKPVPGIESPRKAVP
ncbi:alpha-ketoglutarate-dependent dioxygenase AlkB [Denitrobaculum tricleocarpae]|uniref:Alpha-ketoglutarate-dependent dioxygenase AlkB n=1 Tax=Denitrobaculum tricleocarpae TaxID=2591009 RepID=A0A545TRM7_9PROT|nr:alpha-ketoglutarate-dependent dioxygenase AlkB [Denitrobaculum tricleocarpae]TQV79873.1 alpha-ketoglutarate-dependent dioxygenase AlkB [Denitrobaculum tricleocarpae]